MKTDTRTQVVGVIRNPKDVVVSFHHHCRLIAGQKYVGTFEDFVKYFVEDDRKWDSYCCCWERSVWRPEVNE